MFGGKKKEAVIPSSEPAKNSKENMTMLKRNQSTIKDIIAPGGIDASYTNHIGIMSSRNRYARSMLVSTLPRMCTFPEFLRGISFYSTS